MFPSTSNKVRASAAYFSGSRLWQQNPSNAFIRGRQFLDQDTIQERYEPLCHLETATATGTPLEVSELFEVLIKSQKVECPCSPSHHDVRRDIMIWDNKYISVTLNFMMIPRHRIRSCGSRTAQLISMLVISRYTDIRLVRLLEQVLSLLVPLTVCCHLAGTSSRLLPSVQAQERRGGCYDCLSSHAPACSRLHPGEQCRVKL